jgi:hypothetical protein
VAVLFKMTKLELFFEKKSDYDDSVHCYLLDLQHQEFVSIVNFIGISILDDG